MKCKRWMPWQLEAMKDVVTCDKLRESVTDSPKLIASYYVLHRL